MKSINQIIKGNIETCGSPYFIIDDNEGQLSTFAFISSDTSKGAREVLDAISRELIQQFTNMMYQINTMEISLDLSMVNLSINKFIKSVAIQKKFNDLLADFSYLDKKINDYLFARSGLGELDSSVCEMRILLPKIGCHLSDTSTLIDDQLAHLSVLFDEFRTGLAIEKVVCNNIISGAESGRQVTANELVALNDLLKVLEFSLHLDGFLETLRVFYNGLLNQIKRAELSIRSALINFDAMSHVIKELLSSKKRAFSLLPANSAQVDILALSNEVIGDEVQLVALGATLSKHAELINEVNDTLIEVAKITDQQIDFLGHEVLPQMQPYVFCDLKRVSEEAMLNTQRGYDSSSESL